MHIDRIVGRSLLDALQRARATHGEAAVVLSQEVLQGGDVALAVAVRQAQTIVAKPRLDPLREACGRMLAHGASEAFVERVRATAAARGGASERDIMRQTGHKSAAMVRRYIRDGNLFRANAAGALGL